MQNSLNLVAMVTGSGHGVYCLKGYHKNKSYVLHCACKYCDVIIFSGNLIIQISVILKVFKLHQSFAIYFLFALYIYRVIYLNVNIF